MILTKKIAAKNPERPVRVVVGLLTAVAFVALAGCKSQPEESPKPKVSSSAPTQTTPSVKLPEPPIAAKSSQPPPKVHESPKAHETKQSTAPSEIVAEPGAFPPWSDPFSASPEVRNGLTQAYEAAKASPNDAAKVAELGMFYYCVESAPQAVICFKKAVDLDPNNSKWWFLLGLAHEATFDSAAAIAAFQRVNQLKPTYSPAFVELGLLSLETNTKAARAAFEQVLKLCPDESQAHYGLGRCEELAGHREKALEHYRQALRLVPDYADAHKAMSRMLTDISDRAEAKKHDAVAAKGLVPVTLDDPYELEMLGKGWEQDWLMFIAEQLKQEGRRDQAVYILNRMIERNLRVSDAHNAIGVNYFLEKKYAEAESEFQKAMKGNPENHIIRINLAAVWMEQGRMDEAETALRKVLDAYPTDALALGRYSKLLLAMGRAEDAAANVEEQIKFDPDNSDYHLWRIIATVCMKSPDEAAVLYKDFKSRLVMAERGPDALRRALNQCLDFQRIGRSKISEAPKGWLTADDLAAFSKSLAAVGMKQEAGVVGAITIPPVTPPTSKP